MERRASLTMLVLSIRTNVRAAGLVLEELNRGGREKTYERTLERTYRTVEHDARVIGLQRLADFVQAAKELGRSIQHAPDVSAAVELLDDVGGELARVADDLEAGRPHEIDRPLLERLAQARKALPAGRGPGDLTLS